MNDINNAELPLYFHRLLSHADDMENDPEVSIPVAIEPVGREQVEYLTVENIENLETSSSLSNSQDSYMREINQGNNKSNLELNIPEMPIPSSIHIPTCSYHSSYSPQLPFGTHHSPNSSFVQPDEFSYTSQFPGDTYPLDCEEPDCAVCFQSCSEAHHCPICQRAVHTLCGIQVTGCEGYGAPVWCKNCYLGEREDAIQHSRATAKRGQERLINRMEKQSVKKARVLNIGDNIILPIPVVDKRSPFDPPNLAGVITNGSEEGYYKIGTLAGTLDRSYLSTEIELSHSKFLLPKDVPETTVTLRQAILSSSLGKHRLYCSCISGCGSNRCRCRRAKNTCNSKCHRKLSCHNK